MKILKRLKVAAAFCAALTGSAGLLGAQDWPQWRGVKRDGKTGAFAVPAAWPTNLAQKWKFDAGTGDGTPALVGTNLYVFARQGADEVLFCLDAATGKVNWESRYPAGLVVEGPAVGHPGPWSSPTVAEGAVCLFGVGGILSCLDAGTGAVRWRKQSVADYEGVAYRQQTGMSPLVHQGRCIVHAGAGTNSAMMAFDLRTGALAWKWTGDGPAFSSPVVMDHEGGPQLVTFTSKHLLGVSLADGRKLWDFPYESVMGNNTTPVIDGPMVYVTGQGKGFSAVKIEAKEGRFTATLLWTNQHFSARFATPILKDGMLYGYSGRLFCARAQTGEVVWDEAVNLGHTAALVDTGRVLFAMGVRGDLLAFKPGPQYTQLARIKLTASETWTHPVLAGNRIFLKDRETVGLWVVE